MGVSGPTEDGQAGPAASSGAPSGTEAAAGPEAPPGEGGASRRRRAVAWAREHRPAAALLLLLLAALLVLVIVLFRYFTSYESTDDAQVDGHISAVGTRIAGTVFGVYVEENDRVGAGQLLAELDPRDQEVALQRAQAELAQAEAQVSQASTQVPITTTTTRTGVSTATDEVTNAEAALAAGERDEEAARARLVSAQATSARAQADLRRAESLVAGGAMARQEYDAVAATARAAAAAVAAAAAEARAARKATDQQRARLDQARSRQREARSNAPRQIDVEEAAVDARRAAVQVADAAVTRAQIDLSYTKIVAPFEGIVGKRSAEEGHAVQPGQALFEIVSAADLWVTANFKETQLRQMRPGQRVTIHVDAFDRDYHGHVDSIGPATGARFALLPPENATGNYIKIVQRVPVRIRFEHPKDAFGVLRPGLSVVPKVWLR